jgi:two-component sensor histidine kinase
VVQSISRRTRKTSSSLDEYGTAFDGRIDAPARPQTLLSRESETVPSREFIGLQLDVVADSDPARTTVDGPEVSFPSASAQFVSLALCELATNAIKHGALKDPHGELSVN